LLGLSLLAGDLKRGTGECSGSLITHHGGERCSLSSGERAGVRAVVEPIWCARARRELEKKSGRKVVTSGNYLALTQGAKKVN
jgi:hypothetical protein